MRAFCTAVMAIAIGAALISCSRSEQDGYSDNEDTPNQPIPSEEGWNSTVRASRRGRVEAVVRYGHMSRFSDQKTLHFDEGIRVDFYNSQGNVSSRLSARAGEMNEQDSWVKAIGNVVVESDTGVTLFTEELFYDQSRAMITSETDVVIATAEGDTLYGEGLESDPQMIHYRIIKPRARAHTGLDLAPEKWTSSPATIDTVSVQSEDSSAGMKP
ncbi:MAG TPA: LPS export ABC transporter periplasmic protein LptC [bacterium]|nr:LPS export ABC transporter periplasmic protein LptC [bacterium]HPM98355.1 LPS export ABC transporter periplasmic protein LptC [bacterium]